MAGDARGQLDPRGPPAHRSHVNRRFVALALLFSACRENAGAPDSVFPSTGTPLPCDVDTVFAGHCRQCHTNPPLSGAPMPLLFQENLTAAARSDPSRKVYELVHQRIHDDAHPMPQPPNPRLSDADAKTLDDWIAAGAPAGKSCTVPVDAGPPIPDAAPPPGCVPEALAPTSSWAMPQSTVDAYVCFGVDILSAAKRHVVAIAPKIDNAAIVHHVILYRSDDALSGTPAPCDPGGASGRRVLYAWAPGASTLVLPPEAGFAEEGTTHYVVQLHYSNGTYAPGLTDASGIELCTTDALRPNDADVVAFGTRQITIPARGALDVTCRVSIPTGTESMHVFSAFPHMHSFGKSISTVQVPPDGGTPVDLGSQPHWSFKTELAFAVSATLAQGDIVQTRCAWANPTDQDVTFGYAANQEMCISYTAYYPKVSSAQWGSFSTPSETSTCVPTP
jgi:hypothetical protein